MNALNLFLFVALPYVALVVFLIGTIYRYRAVRFTYSSLSSEFLEKRALFFGAMPFHWGLLFLFFGHLIAFLIPRGVLAWNGDPMRLLILEVAAFAFGLSVLWGLVVLFVRRLTRPRIRVVTNVMDVVILALLIAQAVLGIWTALAFRWGSSWFAAVLTPYLRSLFILNPDVAAVGALPWVVKLHVVGAFLLVLLIPFSRLVHLLVVPLPYLWRPYQRVIWYWNKEKVRDPHAGWTVTKPENT
ncbi:respiratory nitrate reductase subunit gamma [Rhodocaloribacter sp.]